MRKGLRKLIVACTTLILCVGLIGCGKEKSKEESVKDTVETFVNISLGIDDKDATKVTTQSDLDNFYRMRETLTLNSFRSQMTSMGCTLSDEEIKNHYAIIEETIKKIPYKVEVVEEDKDTAVVKVAVNRIDIEGIGEIAAQKAIEEYQDKDVQDPAIKEQFVRRFIELLQDGLKNAVPNEEAEEEEYTVKKDLKEWTDTEKTDFLKDIIELTGVEE